MTKRLLFLIALLCIWAPLCFAQGGSLASGGIIVFGSTGRPQAGATVTICASGATGIPCSPTVNVFTSPSLSIGAANPQTSDGNGNVLVYASPGVYTYTVTGNGISTMGQPFTATVSGSGGGNVIIGSNVGSISFTGTESDAGGSHTGTETFTGLLVPKNIDNAQIVDSTLSRGGSDIGAEINLAYAALPASGGTILVYPNATGVCYNYSTPITFTTAGKFPRLQGMGVTGASSSALTGTCLNYTPTTATAAITVDYFPTGANNPPQISPLRDIGLINNQCVASGGCGSSAVGIQVGNTNAGDNTALYENVSIFGFGKGYSSTNNAAFSQEFRGGTFTANTVAFSVPSVQTRWIDGFIIGNGQAVVATAGSTAELYFTGMFSVENSISGPAFDFTAASVPSILSMVNCHLENAPTQNAHHISGTVNVTISGGVMEDDTSTGTGDWMVQLSGTSYVQATGLQVVASRAYTNVFLFNASSRGFLKILNLAPAALTSGMFVGGANANFVTSMIQPLGSGTAPYTWTFESPIVSRSSQRATLQLSDQGNICTNGELALSAGWQSTGAATVTAVAGNGQTCSWTITTGTTTAASPTVTDTLTNVLPAATTVCDMTIHGGTHTVLLGEGFGPGTLSATAPIFTFIGTPTAGGTTYFVTRRCGP